MAKRSNEHIFNRLALILVVLMALLHTGAAPAAGSQAAQGDGRFEEVNCSTFDIPSTLTQLREVRCGYLTVPEVHESPNGKTIRLGVAIIKSQVKNPLPDPIFLMQGGPGGTTLNDFPSFLQSSSLLRANRDLVLFDQRGTLYTEPKLNCTELKDLTLQTLDQVLPPDESLKMELDATARCRERLVGEGVNLAAYNDRQNANDVESLRQALGYDQINLYGVSYGTMLALEVMRLHPQGLRTVILDSVVTPRDNFVNGIVFSNDRTLDKIFANCAKDPDCSRSYPNLEKVFYEQVDRLNKEPAEITLTDSETGKSYPAKLDGESLIGIFFQVLYVTDILPLVPQMIYDVRAGNYSFIERIASLFVLDFSLSEGMYYSVNCADYQSEPDQSQGEGSLPPQLQKYRKESVEGFLAVCKLWDVPSGGSEEDQPVVSDIPTLITAGELDPATPPENAEEVSQTLSNHYFVLFPGGAHGEVLGNECGEQIMLEFIDNPSVKPDATCAGTQATGFVSDKDVVRLPKLVSLLNLQGTSGPEMIVYGLGLLVLMTAPLVYLIRWIVGLFRNRSQAVPAGGPAGYPGAYAPPVEPAASEARRPLAWRLAPWLPVVEAGLLLIFTIVFLVIVVSMATANDQRLLSGVPATARPLFLITPLAALLALAMLGMAVAAWARRWGSTLGRIYFTILTVAAVACLVMLAVWGMLTAVIPPL